MIERVYGIYRRDDPPCPVDRLWPPPEDADPRELLPRPEKACCEPLLPDDLPVMAALCPDDRGLVDMADRLDDELRRETAFSLLEGAAIVRPEKAEADLPELLFNEPCARLLVLPPETGATCLREVAEGKVYVGLPPILPAEEPTAGRLLLLFILLFVLRFADEE